MTDAIPEEFVPESDPLDEHPEVPEADYLEQHEDELPEYQRGPTIDPEVPEADALDQAIDAEYGGDKATTSSTETPGGPAGVAVRRRAAVVLCSTLDPGGAAAR